MDRSSDPLKMVRLPLIVLLPVNVAVPDALLIVRLLNVFASIDCDEVPLNVTVPDPGENVPELDQLPPNVSVTPLPFSAVDPLMVIFPATVTAAVATTVPEEINRFPFKVVALFIVSIPAVLFTVILLAVIDPDNVCAALPLNVTVLLDGVNTPEV